MKSAIAVLAGFATTLLVFGGGIAFAVFYLTAKPVPVQQPNLDVASTWTQQAVQVDSAAQDFERLPARPIAHAPANDNAASAPAVDPVTTAGIANDDAPEQRPATGEGTAHAEWCANQYRSYDPADDSYTAYSGARRRCVSPHGGQAEGTDGPADSAIVVSDAAYADRTADGFAGSDHAQSCFDRYRSYRPEDNTYQPFSGGPRRQCE